jgi:uncharacterized membrane protein YjfL (UPF0719 family)
VLLIGFSAQFTAVVSCSTVAVKAPLIFVVVSYWITSFCELMEIKSGESREVSFDENDFIVTFNITT